MLKSLALMYKLLGVVEVLVCGDLLRLQMNALSKMGLYYILSAIRCFFLTVIETIGGGGVA